MISTDDFRLLVLLSQFHSNHKNRPLDCSGNFFYFYAIYLRFFQRFRQLTKIAVTSMTFRHLEMTRDCRLDRNGTVLLLTAHVAQLQPVLSIQRNQGILRMMEGLRRLMSRLLGRWKLQWREKM